MKITALVENTAANELVSAEHGLSLYIEANGQKLLFDMGQTNLFQQNAKALSVDLSAVDTAFLSHGHYDHGGGLKRFLELNDKAPVYLNENAFQPHYNGTEKYIGLDTSLQGSSRLVLCGDEIKVSDSMTLYTCNNRQRTMNLGSGGLNMVQGGELVPDDFRHEQYLLITENGKRVLISGCSHKGIVDIAEWFKPDVLIGGFHFSKLPLDEALADYARQLDRYDTEYYTCHCTGVEQYNFMKRYMKRLNYISCGATVEI